MLGTSPTMGGGRQVCWGLVQLWGKGAGVLGTSTTMGEGGRCAGD